jgi:hypothetical protein
MLSSSPGSLLDPAALLHAAIPTLLLHRGQWAIRRLDPGAQWRHQRGRLTDAHLAGMIGGEYWLGTRAPEDGVVDRLAFDVDGVGHGVADEDRDRRYRELRNVLGPGRVPLVVGTPGGGLHIYYRIPRMRLAELVEGPTSGMVADALRAAGLPLGPGALEVFPQPRHILRMPLGPRMPILDPHSLEVLPHAAISAEHDPVMTAGAIATVVDWWARPIQDLVPHLAAMAQTRSTKQSRPKCASVSGGPSATEPGARGVSARALDWVEHGLRVAASRHAAEWQVGVAACIDPSVLSSFGLRPGASAEDLAVALARWLRARHCGMSQEWTAHVRRWGDGEASIQRWATRYLAPDPDGLRPVDRMRRAAARSAPPRVPSPPEMDRIFALAASAFDVGPARYQMEVWTIAAHRAVRQIVAQGHAVPNIDGYLEVQIAADWMAAWPYGAGRLDGSTRYTAFRHHLARTGLLIPVGRPRWYPHETFTGEATRFRVPVPEEHDGSLLRHSIEELGDRLEGLRIHGRAATLEEAVHALHLEDRSLDARGRYGDSVARWIRRVLERVGRPQF